jgi:hypothetical protein
MFCAFEGSPRIVRLHGRGSVLTGAHPDYAKLIQQFPPHVGTRSIIHVAVSRISDSCGYAVPLFEFRGPRDILDRWAETRGEKGLIEYRQSKNVTSIDGLPGLDADT